MKQIDLKGFVLYRAKNLNKYLSEIFRIMSAVECRDLMDELQTMGLGHVVRNRNQVKFVRLRQDNDMNLRFFGISIQEFNDKTSSVIEMPPLVPNRRQHAQADDDDRLQTVSLTQMSSLDRFREFRM